MTIEPINKVNTKAGKKMKINKTKFKDLLIIKQKNNSDKRGSLRETFNKRILKRNFVFEYCTTSKKNALRGFHFQYKFQ